MKRALLFKGGGWLLASGILAGLTAGCQAQMGAGLAPALLLDFSRGTFYSAPDMNAQFAYPMLAAPAEVSAYRVTVPFTFGLGSVAWGNMEWQKLFVENNMSHVVYADYERVCLFGMVESYTIKAYGPRRPQRVK